MAPGLPNGQGQGGGAGVLGLKDSTRVKGQGGGVGAWVKMGRERAWVRGHWFCDPK